MKHDPLRRDIIAALSTSLDPLRFEDCAVDLLRDVFPGLVAVRGGNDAGFDGAIADLVSPTYALVCTTSSDPARNLRGSLEAQRKEGYEGDRIVSATPRQLTPAMQRQLRKQATDLGFANIQIYDQADFANLLYHSPVWCKELLGLTGAPTALSISPLTSRPLKRSLLVGRDAELAWLRSTSGDRLLVGQPGSGKTSVLYQLAREGWGLFLVDDNREHVANAVRSERPSVVVVDDAHVRLDRLRQLRQLRDQIGAEFDIVATCWPGSDPTVQVALQIPRAKVRELPLLHRDQIVQVVKGVGIGGPDVLIGAIVTQADGRPGLAVTLADACLQGDVDDVIRGDAIANNIGEMLAASNWGENSRLLAAFALGGDAGMPQAAIGASLGLPPLALAQRIADLAYAGIVKTVPSYNKDETYIAVEPTALRAALVRDAFFRGPGTLDFRPLAGFAPDPTALAQSLVDAQASGANIGQEQLLPYLDRANSRAAWKSYASLGTQYAEWVLRNRPHLTVAVAEAALYHAPKVAIPALLELAKSDLRPTAQHPDHPIRQIEDWIHEAHPLFPSGLSAVERRRTVIRCAAEWMRQGGDMRVGVRALTLGLNPDFRTHSLDPGLGRTITFTQGTLPDPDLEALAGLWTEVREVIASATDANWPDVFAGIAQWAFPSHWQQSPLPNRSRESMRSTASAMLRDVVELTDGRRGVLQQAHALAQRAKLDLDIPLDPVFFTLYGHYDDYEDSDRGHAEAQANEDLDQLVSRWKDLDAKQVADELASLEREATAVGITYPRRTGFLANRLSAAVEAQTHWLQAFVAAKLGPDVILPFLQRTTDSGEVGWPEAIENVLDRPSLVAAGVRVILTIPDPPQNLLEKALGRVSEYVHIVEWCSRRGIIPVPTLIRLLQHPDDAVAGEAAYGEWMSDPHGTVRPEITQAWRSAALRDPEEYHQVAILEAEPSISQDWLHHRILAGEHLWFFDSRHPTAVALDALSQDERRSILELLKNETANPQFVARLVGDDATLYAELLGSESLNWMHTAPLMGELTAAWVERAQLALKHGVTPEEIAGAVIMPHGVIMTGHSSEIAGKIAELEQFIVGQDPEITQILNIAIEREKSRLSRQLVSEHHEAVHGFR